MSSTTNTEVKPDYRSGNDSNTHTSHKNAFWSLTLGCTGVVYGDIGTSPLYAFREAISHAPAIGGQGLTDCVLGVLSLIFWALVIIVTLKYVSFLLRLDNKGEGGILSLMSLAKKKVIGDHHRKATPIYVLAILGAALFYGDAAITPAISVLSAIEGLKLVTPVFEPWILPISVAILITLFTVQQYGTHSVSALFGPIMVIWFLVLGVTGTLHIMENYSVLQAINPWHAVYFLSNYSEVGFVTLGAVFLAVTGAEALYADLGHFGRKPIQMAWMGLAFPCLVLNYMGQGALVLANPAAIENSFFLMAPDWALLPLVLLAAVATIIASQAVITGAYSLTRQAMQLGMLPRLEICHTSSDQEGQIYMPQVNRWLLWMVLLLCVMFGSSSDLAAAYGISVTGTMIITSILAFLVLHRVWHKSIIVAGLITLPFIAIELVFLFANLFKVFDGGFVTLFIASLLTLLMLIWASGTRYLYVRARRSSVPLQKLLHRIEEHPPIWIDGTAVFMTSDPNIAPMALIQNIRHNKVMHKKNIILTVATEPTPYVLTADSLSTEQISPNIIMAKLHFGYMQTPNVPSVLTRYGVQRNIVLDLKNVTYFLSRRIIVPTADSGLSLWQDKIYVAMNRISATASDFFHLPVEQVIELGQQMEL